MRDLQFLNRGSSCSLRRACLAMLVCLLGGPVFVVPSALAESLPQALGSAYGYNPRLDAQRAFLRATDEDVPIAMSGYRPQIFGEAVGGWRRDDDIPSTILDGVTKPYGFRIDGVQPIFRGFQTYNAVNAAEANVRAEREVYRDVEGTILLEAVTAYMDVV